MVERLYCKIRFNLAMMRAICLGGIEWGLILLLGYGAWHWADPTPPSSVVLATGSENSPYAQFGQICAGAPAAHGIGVSQSASLGSQEKLERLNDDESGAILVLCKAVPPRKRKPSARGGFLWAACLLNRSGFFYRGKAEFVPLAQLRGKKVNVGAECSGVPRMQEPQLANQLAPNQSAVAGANR